MRPALVALVASGLIAACGTTALSQQDQEKLSALNGVIATQDRQFESVQQDESVACSQSPGGPECMKGLPPAQSELDTYRAALTVAPQPSCASAQVAALQAALGKMATALQDIFAGWSASPADLKMVSAGNQLQSEARAEYQDAVRALATHGCR